MFNYHSEQKYKYYQECDMSLQYSSQPLHQALETPFSVCQFLSLRLPERTSGVHLAEENRHVSR